MCEGGDACVKKTAGMCGRPACVVFFGVWAGEHRKGSDSEKLSLLLSLASEKKGGNNSAQNESLLNSEKKIHEDDMNLRSSKKRNGENYHSRIFAKVSAKILPLAEPFVIPPPFIKYPLVMSPLPSARNPNGMRARRTFPTSRYPNVAMMPRVPLIISGNPHCISMRSNDNTFSSRMWRPYTNAQPDMNLRRCRSG